MTTSNVPSANGSCACLLFERRLAPPLARARHFQVRLRDRYRQILGLPDIDPRRPSRTAIALQLRSKADHARNRRRVLVHRLTNECDPTAARGSEFTELAVPEHPERHEVQTTAVFKPIPVITSTGFGI
jgi:hypothetical protein